MAAVTIRNARAADGPDLRLAFIGLQEYERSLYDNRLPGEVVADRYLLWMMRQATERSGAVFVAESAGRFCGFAACWLKRDEAMVEIPDSAAYGYLSDIWVVPEYRRAGVAGELIRCVERHCAERGAARLRLGVLAANTSAQAVYEKNGFLPYEVTYEKLLRPKGAD